MSDLGQKHWKILSEEPNIVTDFVWKQAKANAYTTKTENVHA